VSAIQRSITAAQPLKTLARGLKLAGAGTTVKLAAGGYGPGFSGDQFAAGGLVVPAGVTIDGGGPDGSPGATLLGPGSGVGLNLAGSATVRNLVWGGQGFGVGLVATRGKQTLSNLFIGMGRGATGPVGGGATANGGVFLRGSAQTTLKNSTIFLLGGGATGVSANEQARLTMDGGTITGGDQANCRTDAFGIKLAQSAQATLKNVNNPGLQNLAGTALSMRDTSKATLSESVMLRDLTAGCDARPSVTVDNSAALTLLHSVVQQGSTGSQAIVGAGIVTTSDAPLALLSATTVSGYATALDVFAAKRSLALDRASFTRCGVCVDARFAKGPVTVTNSSFRGV
jgi:Protein of unknown function (DUF1565)